MQSRCEFVPSAEFILRSRYSSVPVHAAEIAVLEYVDSDLAELPLTKSQLVRNMACVYLKSRPRSPHDELTCANVSVQVLENT